MNNATTTPYISGDTREFASTARKAFIFIENQFNSKYYGGGETTAFLKSLNMMLDTEYCDLQISDKASGAKGVAAACRAAVYALAPFEQDFTVEYAELNRVTNFLEMSINNDATYNA